MIKLKIILLAALYLFLNMKGELSAQESTKDHKKEVLLIGTFHFNNPGADVAKTKSFDILKEESQKELDFIAAKIEEFNPSKIFVEWPYNEQNELDSLYRLHLEGKYFTNNNLNDFYKKNEIFQLAFRVGALNKLDRIYGIDYNDTDFPFDSLMTVIGKNNQIELQNKFMEGIQFFTAEFDNKIEQGVSLTELMYYLNSKPLREMSNEFHTQLPLLAGEMNNFIGPYLSAEWYKRNLYMWSLVQKNVDSKDEKIMILSGASHAAMFDIFIEENNTWKVIELNSIMD